MVIGKFIEYKGFVGSIEYSNEDKIHYGKLLDIKDLVNYEANDVEELYEQYKNAVDNYINFCKEVGKVAGQ